MILLKNGTVYSPSFQGVQDILIAGEKIVAIADRIIPPAWDFLHLIDLEERWVFPGFIDSHIHIAGAGGEGGPATRTRDLTAQEILAAGITTVIGCLGTDGITRSVTSVLMKAKELNCRGLSAWIYTGAYQVPTPTITGSIASDLALINEVIGTGEIAIADHRSSFPTVEEFIKLTQQTKLGAMMGGKAGIVNIHLGENGAPFDLLYRAAEQAPIHFARFLPTHCNRTRPVFEDAKIYAQKGPIDLTTSSYPYYADVEIKPSAAFFELLAAGVPLEHITLSTDAGGSLPEFDANGHFVKIAYGSPASLLNEILDIINHDASQTTAALHTVTANPARLLKLEQKGRIAPGADADILVLDKQKTGIEHLFARGKQHIDHKQMIV